MSTATQPLLVVCERDLRTHARNLVRAVSTFHPVDWCFDSEFEQRVKQGERPRMVFLGNGPFARFLRRLSGPEHRAHGVVWSAYKHNAFVFNEDVIIDLRATLPLLRDHMEQVATETRYRSAGKHPAPGGRKGHFVAQKYFELVEHHPALRLARSATREADVKQAFNDTQYVVGIGWFLLEGWDALMQSDAF